MPLGAGRGNAMQNVQHYAITDNPVFKIKVRSLDTDLEQVPSYKDDDEDKHDFTKKFKLGEKITGQVKGEKEIKTGEIVKLDRDSSYITIIDDKTNKKFKLDPATCKSKDGDEVRGRGWEVNWTAEEYLIGLDEFQKL